MVFNNSSLFMTMLNLIGININIMDMETKHVNLFFHIDVDEQEKKNGIIIRMKIVIRKIMR
jgi:hypothetical protein